MTSSEAEKIFNSKHSNLKVVAIIDYDKDHFVIEAITPNAPEVEMDPFYGIDKNTKEITNFMPGLDPVFYKKLVEAERAYGKSVIKETDVPITSIRR